MSISKISILSLLLSSCAGAPPKMERPVRLYSGAPEEGGVCRLTKAAIARIAKKNLIREESEKHVKAVVNEMFAPDEVECVRASAPEFKQFGCYRFSDIAVMLRYQESLLYACQRWAPQSAISSIKESAENPHLSSGQ